MSYSELVNKVLIEITQNPSVASELSRWRTEKSSLTFENAQNFSQILGSATSKALQAYTPENLGEDLGDYARDLVAPIYSHVAEVTTNYCNDVTSNIMEKRAIRYNPNVKIDVNKDISEMLSNLVDRFDGADTYAEISFLTEENAARSVTRKATTSHMKYTSQKQESAGLKISIERYSVGGCCAWCDSMCGKYSSYAELPDDFWRVHRNCTCLFNYNVGRTSEKIRYTTDDNGRMSKVTY